eukprot:6488157-Pyramimonas_sp.AAC.1
MVNSALPRHVHGDSDRLKQILVNLLSNAIKFTLDGEVMVRVNLLKTTNRYLDVEFAVKDTGIGIAKDALKKLFSRFTQ